MDFESIEKNCVFRYRTTNKNALKEVLNSQIWHSTIAGLNDPFEFPTRVDSGQLQNLHFDELVSLAIHFNIMSSDEMAYCLCNNIEISPIILSNLSRFDSAIQEYVNTLLVACFSASARSPLMWSHYADGMKGICIAFNRKALEVDDFIKLYPVIYNKSPMKLEYTDLAAIPVIPQSKFYDFERGVNSIVDGFLIRFKIYDYLFQKHERWSYEGELRNIIDPHKRDCYSKNGELVDYARDAVSAIIIGSKIDAIKKKMIVKYCGRKEIPVFVASPEFTDYTVNIRPL